jgi:hypothetical protein
MDIDFRDEGASEHVSGLGQLTSLLVAVQQFAPHLSASVEVLVRPHGLLGLQSFPTLHTPHSIVVWAQHCYTWAYVKARCRHAFVACNRLLLALLSLLSGRTIALQGADEFLLDAVYVGMICPYN